MTYADIYSVSLSIRISDEDAQRIGQKIWYNESRMSIEKLTFWNENEPFPSLGIGHFIWYPHAYAQVKHFKESFPRLIRYMKKHHVSIPSWIARAQHAPWSNRKIFYASCNSSRMKELRTFLHKTIDIQARFIIDDFKDSLSNMLESLPVSQRRRIINQCNRVASHVNGIYALVDYANFKGVSCEPVKAYNNARWGLGSVLLCMKGTSRATALKDFCISARNALCYRAAHAPSDETHWIPGWFTRINSYME
jgi:hypothetical protein